MNYPDELLPKSHYKFIHTDLSNYHLIRTITTIDCLDENGFVKIEHIANPRHRLANLSVHILSVFDYKHLHIVICGERKTFLTSNCDTFSNKVSLKYEEDFTLHDSNWFWTLKVGDLHNDYQCEIKGRLFHFSPTVVHCPTICNFWHFEIRWTIINSSFTEESSSQQKKILDAMYAEARKTVQVLATSTKVADYDCLKREDYCL